MKSYCKIFSICFLICLSFSGIHDYHFQYNLHNATANLPVGSPLDLKIKVKLLIQPPNLTLMKGFTQFEESEERLLKSKLHPFNPSIWILGIKKDVKPAPFTLREEFFVSVLGLEKADSVEHAFALMNQTSCRRIERVDSLNECEQQVWLNSIEGGNFYVNRRMTGTLVERRSFGECKANSSDIELRKINVSHDYQRYVNLGIREVEPLEYHDSQHFLLNTKAAKQWRKIGIYEHYGAIIPLFSLYSRQSLGCGEFFDLIPLINWAKNVGFDTLQLLPLNDCNNQPFNIYSAFALDYIYLTIAQLPKATELIEYKQVVKALNDKGKIRKLEWEFVRVKKEIFLKKYFDKFFDEVVTSLEYQEFVINNKWLKGYALFKSLKRVFGEEKTWESWPDPVRTAQPDVLNSLSEQFAEKINFFCFVQFLCFQQLEQIKKIATAQGVFLMGDLPYLPQKDSADVWLNQKLFFNQPAGGGSVGVFSELRQEWGFPAYNWSEASKSGYAWWLSRIEYAVNFYHIYQIAPAGAIFKLRDLNDFKLKLNLKTKSLEYIKHHFNEEELNSGILGGKHFIEVLLAKMKEMPILKHLNPHELEIDRTIQNLGVCGVKSLFQLLRKTYDGHVFLDLSIPPPQSVTTTALHEGEPIRLWWQNHPPQSREIAKSLGWTYDPLLARAKVFELLQLGFNTASLFHLNLLEDYLDLVGELSPQDPTLERVNIPGTISDFNWSFRFIASLEQIVSNHFLRDNIRNLINKKFYLSSEEKTEQKGLDLAKDWYNTNEDDKDIQNDLKDLAIPIIDNLRQEFSLIGSTESEAPISSKILTLVDVISSTIQRNPRVAAASFKVKAAIGKFRQSMGPFDPEVAYTGNAIISYDMQYPPQNIRTHQTGKEYINEVVFRKKARSGAELTASITIDQNLNRLLPIFGPEPISRLNTTVIEFKFIQPLLKNFILNKDAIQERVNRLAIDRAYYTYLDNLSLSILDSLLAYWDWIAAEWFLEARQISVKRMSRAFAYFLSLYELDLVTREDISQIQGWLDQRKVALVNAEVISNTALQNLKTLMGIGSDEYVCFRSPEQWQNSTFPLIVTDSQAVLDAKNYLIEQAKQNRYDIIASLVDQDIFSVYLEGARNQLLPRLDIFIDCELSDFTARERAKKYFSSSHFPKSTEKDISIGVKFSIPFYRDKAKGEVIQSIAGLQESKYTTEALRQDAERMVLDSLFKIQSLPQSIEYAKNGQIEYLKLLEIEGRKTTAGAIFAYIEFERRLNDAINDEINAFNDLLKSIATLYYSTGQLVNFNQQPNLPIRGGLLDGFELWEVKPNEESPIEKSSKLTKDGYD
jgi:4-alpha-glucanotransferase